MSVRRPLVARRPLRSTKRESAGERWPNKRRRVILSSGTTCCSRPDRLAGGQNGAAILRAARSLPAGHLLPARSVRSSGAQAGEFDAPAEWLAGVRRRSRRGRRKANGTGQRTTHRHIPRLGLRRIRPDRSTGRSLADSHRWRPCRRPARRDTRRCLERSGSI